MPEDWLSSEQIITMILCSSGKWSVNAVLTVIKHHRVTPWAWSYTGKTSHLGEETELVMMIGFLVYYFRIKPRTLAWVGRALPLSYDHQTTINPLPHSPLYCTGGTGCSSCHLAATLMCYHMLFILLLQQSTLLWIIIIKESIVTMSCTSSSIYFSTSYALHQLCVVGVVLCVVITYLETLNHTRKTDITLQSPLPHPPPTHTFSPYRWTVLTDTLTGCPEGGMSLVILGW